MSAPAMVLIALSFLFLLYITHKGLALKIGMERFIRVSSLEVARELIRRCVAKPITDDAEKMRFQFLFVKNFVATYNSELAELRRREKRLFWRLYHSKTKDDLEPITDDFR